MLFDLRSPGRRLAIKVIYVFLALLLGGGLVLFGVGSGVQGGLFDALKGGDSNSVSDDTFIKRADQQQKFTVTHPADAAAFAQLARLRFQAAGTGFDQDQQAYTEAGQRQLTLADRAWTKHLELAGDKPDASVAGLMVQAYVGLNDAAKAAAAKEVVIAARGDSATANEYLQLATYAYAAGQKRKGRLAAQKALELTPKDEREAVKAQIDSIRQSAAGQSSSGTPSQSSP